MSRSDAVFVLYGNGSVPVRCLNPVDVINALEAERLPIHSVQKANSLRFGHGPVLPEGYFLISNADYKTYFTRIVSSIWPYQNIQVVIRYLNNEQLVEETILYGIVTEALRVLGAENDNSAVVLIKVDHHFKFNNDVLASGKVAANQQAVVRAYNLLKSNDYSDTGLPYIVYGQGCNDGSGVSCYDYVGNLRTLSDVLESFFDNAVLNDFGTAGGYTYSEDKNYPEVFHNLITTGMTALEFLNKLCEIARITYAFRNTGIINNEFIITSQIANWPNTTDAIYSTVSDDQSTDYIRNVLVDTESMDWMGWDDRILAGLQQGSPHWTYDIPVSDDADLNPNALRRGLGITIPNLIRSTLLQNEIKVEEDVNSITQRFLALEAINDKISHWKYYKNLHNNVSFGLDEVIYSDYGDGIGTTAISKSIGNQALNYKNPKMNDHVPNPLGMWLYCFTLTTPLTPCKSTAKALLTPLATSFAKEIPGTVINPHRMFDLPVGAEGLCIRIHRGPDYGSGSLPNGSTLTGKDVSLFYIIQSRPGCDEPSSSSSSSSSSLLSSSDVSSSNVSGSSVASSSSSVPSSSSSSSSSVPSSSSSVPSSSSSVPSSTPSSSVPSSSVPSSTPSSSTPSSNPSVDISSSAEVSTSFGPPNTCECPPPETPGPFPGATSVITCTSIDLGICTGDCAYEWDGTQWNLLYNNCVPG